MANAPNELKGEIIKHCGSIEAMRQKIRRSNGDLYAVGQFSGAINGKLNGQIGAEIRSKCWMVIQGGQNA